MNVCSPNVPVPVRAQQGGRRFQLPIAGAQGDGQADAARVRQVGTQGAGVYVSMEIDGGKEGGEMMMRAPPRVRTHARPPIQPSSFLFIP